MRCKHCGQQIPETASDQFEAFWAVWPNKVSKKKAQQKWKRYKLDYKADLIIADVRMRIEKDPRWLAGCVPDPVTYINGDRWEDEINVNARPIKWPTENNDWLEMGARHGLSPKTGESWPQFKDRVRRVVGG